MRPGQGFATHFEIAALNDEARRDVNILDDWFTIEKTPIVA